MKTSAFVFICCVLTACSIYKSENRESFESKAHETLGIQNFQAMGCDEISPVQYWYESHFPAPNAEWIESPSQHLEVLQIPKEHGQIAIQSYEHTPPTITRCAMSFATQTEWNHFKDFYFKSLEGDQP